MFFYIYLKLTLISDIKYDPSGSSKSSFHVVTETLN